jgi:hypothetical protein
MLILSFAAAALLLTPAAQARANCGCRHKTYRTAHYRTVYSEPVYTVSARRCVSCRSAWIKTDVEPDEARVYLDGRYVGTADDYDGWPRKLRVSAGSHRLTFRLRGHVPYSVVVNAAPGRVVDIDYWLKS